MSTDLPIQLDGWDIVSESLGELRAGYEESGRFFVELFDRVESSLSELLHRQEEWERERDEIKSELNRRAELLDQQEHQHRIDLERAAAERALPDGQATQCDGEQQRWLHTVLDKMGRDWDALRESLPDRDGQASLLADVVEQLAGARSELAEARAEIQRLAQPLALATQEGSVDETCERLRTEMDMVREDRDAMRQERVLLESELEHIRGRAAQLAETVETQKQVSVEQELHWREEFRRQSGLLEELAGLLSIAKPDYPVVFTETAPGSLKAGSTDVTRRGPARSESSEDSALESVRAQFELLQKEATRRRRGNVD
ncbi:MAG: hypothetical protein JW888_17150 [Pirellulales bacterium]|nr:hypothetical protein [Pirellulales bacterium]